MFDRIRRGLAARGELRGMRDKFAPSPEDQLHYYPGYDFPMLPRDYRALTEARNTAAGNRQAVLTNVASAESKLHPFNRDEQRKELTKDWINVVINGYAPVEVNPADYGFVLKTDNGGDAERTTNNSSRSYWVKPTGETETRWEEFGENTIRNGHYYRDTPRQNLQSFYVPRESVDKLADVEGLPGKYVNNRKFVIDFSNGMGGVQNQVMNSFHHLEESVKQNVETALDKAERQWNTQVAEAHDTLDSTRTKVSNAEQAENITISERNRQEVEGRNNWAYNATHMKMGGGNNQ